MKTPSKEAREERVRTTVRIPQSLHNLLRQVSAARDQTAESLIESAIAHELTRLTTAELPTSTDWSPLLAQRFFECIPTAVVIKDPQARILWCNCAYELLFRMTQHELRGRTVESLGALDEYSSQRLHGDIQKLTTGKRRGTPMEFWEPMTIRGANRVFRALRFGFDTNFAGKPTELFGDVSFDWTAMHVGRLQPVMESLTAYITSNVIQPEAEGVFVDFLQKCPSAVAIKRLSGHIVWCNSTYLRLVGNSTRLTDVLGRTTQDLFGLSVGDPIVQNNHIVGRENVWMYGIESLPQKEPRTSLRFPIPGPNWKPAFVGVASADFQLKNVEQMTFVRKDRTLGDART